VAKRQSIKETKKNNFKRNEKLGTHCKSYDSASCTYNFLKKKQKASYNQSFLGLNVNTKKLAKTNVIAITSRMILLKSTVGKLDKFVLVPRGAGCHIGEYPNETGIPV
jgi:hypothetical protein